MRVLLFVEREGRPRLVKKDPLRCIHATAGRHGERASCDACMGTGWIIYDKASMASRWWLVECENAEDGRFLLGFGSRCSWPPPTGRILASGGKSE